MPLIRVTTKDPFAVTAVCDWADSQDVDNLDVSQPDADDVVTVTLYGMPETDPRFAKFAALVAEPGDDGRCPWTSAEPFSVPLDRILVESVGDGWNAHLEALPTICYFGREPAEAAQQLCDDFGISTDRLKPGNSGREDVLLVLVEPEDRATCPDCRGSGKYVGFASVDSCRRCGGSGSV